MPHSSFYYAQPQMTLERVEVTIAMKQLVIFDNAEARDKRIDSLAHGDSPTPQCAKILRCRDCNGSSPNRHTLQYIQLPTHAMEVQVRAKTLQNLDQDQVAEQGPLSGQQTVQQISFRRWPPVEVINPDGRIDQDHSLTKRSRRIASRSPSHLS